MKKIEFSEKEKEAFQKVLKDLEVIPNINLIQLQTLDKEKLFEGFDELKVCLSKQNEMERMCVTGGIVAGGAGHIYFFANPDRFKDFVFLIQVDFTDMDPKEVARLVMFRLVSRLKELEKENEK
ncbi:MAG: hypothetical protein JHC30_07235 [Caldisericum sp.]|jgi:hypothetical protein|nr:hypothetical protein [Caldisericum sp.]